MSVVVGVGLYSCSDPKSGTPAWSLVQFSRSTSIHGFPVSKLTV
jgi:hypothetical protein